MHDNPRLALGSFLLFLLCFSGTIFAQKANKETISQEPVKNSADNKNLKPNSKEAGETAEKADASPAEDKSEVIPENYRLQRGEKEFTWEMGVSPFNPSNFAGPKEYDVYGRHLYLTNFRLGRVIGTKGFVTYEYFFSATPLAIFTKNEVKNPKYISSQETPNVAPTIRQTTVGFGIQPVNFKFIFYPDKRLKPFAQVGAGILFTTKAVPVPVSKPFNFTGEFGGGFQYFATRRKAVTFGYKYFHISNGNIGGKINNPGFNANVFYIGYSFFYK